MDDSDKSLATVLNESATVGLPFQTAVNLYLGMMEADGEVAPRNMALSILLQEQLARRFGWSADVFYGLVESIGACKAVSLFWPTFVAVVTAAGMHTLTPMIVVEFTCEHLRSCAECQVLSKKRFEKGGLSASLLNGILKTQSTF